MCSRYVAKYLNQTRQQDTSSKHDPQKCHKYQGQARRLIVNGQIPLHVSAPSLLCPARFQPPKPSLGMTRYQPYVIRSTFVQKQTHIFSKHTGMYSSTYPTWSHMYLLQVELQHELAGMGWILGGPRQTHYSSLFTRFLFLFLLELENPVDRTEILLCSRQHYGQVIVGLHSLW